MTTGPDYDGPVYVGVEGDEPELVDVDVDEGPVPAAGERAVVLDLGDPIYDGQTLPEVTEPYQHVHSSTGVCVKHPNGLFCDPAPAVPVGVQPARTWIEARSNAMTDNPQTGRPAVPVVHSDFAEGKVNPEPAEEGETLPGWKPLEFPNLHEVIREVTFAEMSRQSEPPVVHPEPGDRWEFDSEANAGYLRLSSGRVYVAKTRALHPAVNVDLTADGSIVGVEILFPGSVAAAVAAVRADLAARERQIAAVEQALDVEGWVIERGAHDRGVQLACQRIRRALADPESFLNPTPAAAVRSATKEES